MNMASLEDHELIAEYQKTGNTLFVKQLTDRYAQHILSYGWKNIRNEDDVKDFAQDVFQKLCAKLKSAKVESFKSWLYTAMRNMVIDSGRRKTLWNGYVDEERKREGITTLGFVETEYDMQYLRQALDELSEKEKSCMVLLYFQDRSYAEIMDETGMTFNQIRGIKDRTLKKLREKLSTIYEERKAKRAK